MAGQIQNDMAYMVVIQLVEHLLPPAGRFKNPGFTQTAQMVAGQRLGHAGKLREAANRLRLLQAGNDQLQPFAIAE